MSNDNKSAAAKTVLYVMGTSYSGSSLLNALLDNQPGIRGLGEAHYFGKPDAQVYCAVCKVLVLECEFKKTLLPSALDLYDKVFAADPETQVLVNASKHPSLLWRPPIPPGVRAAAVVLAKSPHAFAHSYGVHHPESGSVPAWLTEWFEVHVLLLRCLARAAHSILALDREEPAIPPELTCVLQYRRLATDTAGVVQQICKMLGQPFDPQAMQLWGHAKGTHTVGGNYAVWCQRVKDIQFFETREYLDGKYREQWGQVFHDEVWRADEPFKQAAAEFYQQPMSADYTECLARLGFGTVDDLLADLKQ